jgi:hypothetical protein
MRPKELVLEWVKTFNTADAGALATFYAEDAVNHQVANVPVEGRAAIRKMFETEFANAEMTCIVENVFEDGEWGCGFFKFADNKIVFQRGYWDKLSFHRLHNIPLER